MDVDEVANDVTRQAVDIAEQSIVRLRTLWGEMFQAPLCVDYLIKLPRHIQIFYDEVYEESYNRRENMISSIAALREEAQNLERLLREPVTIDWEADEGLPLQPMLSNLDRQLSSMREKLKERERQIDDYLQQQETLCEELEEEPRSLGKDPLPTEAELADFKAHLERLSADKEARYEEISALRKEMKSLMPKLEWVPHTDRQIELVNDRNIQPSSTNMRDLRKLHERILSQYNDLKERIDEVRHKLQELWTVLEMSPSTKKRYDKYRDYTQTSYDKLFAELDRCKDLRRQNMAVFVQKVRQEIVDWWNKCLKSEEERSRFSTFYSDVFNEDLLTLHEMELKDLQDFYNENITIFNLIEQRQQLWEKKLAHEQRANDPSRYNNRGGKLLEEEKERRRINVQLPKVEEQLMEVCRKYETDNQRTFTIFGVQIEEMVRQQWSKHEESKAMISSARKQAQMLTPNGANRTAVGRTPRTGDTMMKSLTGGRTKTLASGSLLKTPTSTSKHQTSSVTKLSSAGLKRKQNSPKYPSQTKRSLFRDIASPKLMAPPRSVGRSRIPLKSPVKVPTMKVYETKAAVSAAQKRRSSRRSTNKSTRRSNSRGVPRINVIPSSSESVSYEDFENFFEYNTPKCRSSLKPRRTRRHLLSATTSSGSASTSVVGGGITGKLKPATQGSPIII